MTLQRPGKKTLHSPLGPPPSVVLMPKHINDQFEMQQAQQHADNHAPMPDRSTQGLRKRLYANEGKNASTIVDDLLFHQHQNRRLRLHQEMGQAVHNLRQKQARFQQYMDTRTTPPKHKMADDAAISAKTNLQTIDYDTALDHRNLNRIAGKNGLVPRQATRNVPAKTLAEQKRQYHRRKIHLRKKRRQKRREKEFRKWKKYKKKQKELKRRKKEKKLRRRQRKMRRKRQQASKFKFMNGKTSDACITDDDFVGSTCSDDSGGSSSCSSSSSSTSSDYTSASESDMAASSSDNEMITMAHCNNKESDYEQESSSLKQLRKMKKNIMKKVHENVSQIKSPNGKFYKENKLKSSPTRSKQLHSSVYNARRKRKQQSGKKPLPPMNSPPHSIKKINIIPSRPRLPDLQTLRRRNEADGVMLDAAIERYRSTALTASLSLPQSTRPRNSQVCGLNGSLLMSPSKKHHEVPSANPSRSWIIKQRKRQRHTMPGLRAIEEVRQKLSPISTPTHKWGFTLHPIDATVNVSTPSPAGHGKRRQRSSTLSQVIVTPKGNEGSLLAKVQSPKVQSSVLLKPILSQHVLPPRTKESKKLTGNEQQEEHKDKKEGSNPLALESKPRRKKKQQQKKKMNSNQQLFVQTLSTAKKQAVSSDASIMTSQESRKRPSSPQESKAKTPTYKKKAPAPLLTFHSIKKHTFDTDHNNNDTVNAVENGITLNTDGSFVSNFSNGSPSIWL